MKIENKMHNKKGVIAIDKIIIIILVIFVLALVLAFIFRANLPGFFKFLPSFSEPEGVEYIPPSEDFIIRCVKIAEIRAPERGGFLQSKEQYVYVEGQKTDLYWASNGKEIKLKRLGLKKDTVIGIINDLGIVSIYNIFLSEESEAYQSLKEKLPSLTILKTLNGARYISNNVLCRILD